MKKVLMTLAVAAFAFAANAEEKEISGKLGCAHCDYSAAKKCAVGVKTDDGKVFVVSNADAALMKARHDKAGKTIVVKGEVSGSEIKASSSEIK